MTQWPFMALSDHVSITDLPTSQRRLFYTQGWSYAGLEVGGKVHQMCTLQRKYTTYDLIM